MDGLDAWRVSADRCNSTGSHDIAASALDGAPSWRVSLKHHDERECRRVLSLSPLICVPLLHQVLNLVQMGESGTCG